jgi:hypothetical protein
VADLRCGSRRPSRCSAPPHPPAHPAPAPRGTTVEPHGMVQLVRPRLPRNDSVQLGWTHNSNFTNWFMVLITI